MGNCVKKEASMEWGGDDWGSLSRSSEEDDDHHKTKKKVKEEENGPLLKITGPAFSSSSSSAAAAAERKSRMITEVKVKITKKQLEELLGKTDIQGISVQQVLEQLIKVSDGYESHQRSWRPALHSIPETFNY